MSKDLAPWRNPLRRLSVEGIVGIAWHLVGARGPISPWAFEDLREARRGAKERRMKHGPASNAAADPTERVPSILWFDAEVAAIKEALPASETERIKLLGESRTEFYEALVVYYSQVKYSTSSIFAILAGIFAMLNLSPASQGKSIALPSALIPIGLLLGASLCIFFLVAAAGQYSLYLSAVIFSAKLHFACGIIGHPWFAWVRIYAAPPATSGDDIIRRWMLSWTKGQIDGMSAKRIPNTFITYAAVMLLLCTFCLGGCLYFLIANIYTKP